MRLAKHSDYSLRVLMFLALKPDECHTIQELSDRFAISRNHLMKVVHHLVSQEYVDSTRSRLKCLVEMTQNRLGYKNY